MKERVWLAVDATDETGKRALTRAMEVGFTTFVTPRPAPAAWRGLGRIRLLEADAEGLHEGDELVAPRFTIESPDDQAAVMAAGGKHPAVLVEARSWRVIPHENLIAGYAGTGTQLVVHANDIDEARVLLETLEKGVDVVILPVSKAAEAAAVLADEAAQDLAVATVTAIRNAGMGDRACVDTTSLLAEDEGLLTGSASGALVLVASEARDSGYVAGRPFRVNAGAVHAYVLAPDGKTRYLSELTAGDEVVAVRPGGKARIVVIGRVKLERRPMLLIEAECDGTPVKTILQNAETIRIVGPDGTRSVVDLRVGDEVYVRLDGGGRHFGMRVDETITER